MFFLAEPDIRQWMIDWNEGAASSLQTELSRQTAVLLPLLTASSIKKDKRNKHKCPRSRDRTLFDTNTSNNDIVKVNIYLQ